MRRRQGKTPGESEPRESSAKASRSGSLVSGMMNMVKMPRIFTQRRPSRPVDEMAGFAAAAAAEDGQTSSEIFCENPHRDVQLELDSLESDALEFDLPLDNPKPSSTKRHSKRASRRSMRQSLRSTEQDCEDPTMAPSPRLSMSRASSSASSSSSSRTSAATRSITTASSKRVSIKSIEDFPSDAPTTRDLTQSNEPEEEETSTASNNVLRRLSMSVKRRSAQRSSQRSINKSRANDASRRESLRSKGMLRTEGESAEDLAEYSSSKGKSLNKKDWSRQRSSGARRSIHVSARSSEARAKRHIESSADVVIKTSKDIDILRAAIGEGEARYVRFSDASEVALTGLATVLADAGENGPVALDISGARGDDGLEMMMHALSEGAGEVLESLNLSRTPLDRVFKQFVHALENMPALRELTLRMCMLSTSQIAMLSNVLPSTSVVKLDLSGNDLSEETLEVLLSSGGLEQTQELVLRACGLDDASASTLAAGIVDYAREILIIDLSGNPITSACCEDLAAMFRGDGPVEDIDLSYTQIDADGVMILSAALADPGCTLRALDLRSCALGVEGCFALAEGLEVNTSVERLTVGGPVLPPLSTHGVCDEGAARLLEMLKVNEVLTSLTVAEGTLGSDAQYVLSQLASIPIEARKTQLGDMFLRDVDKLNMLTAMKNHTFRGGARSSSSRRSLGNSGRTLSVGSNNTGGGSRGVLSRPSGIMEENEEDDFLVGQLDSMMGSVSSEKTLTKMAMAMSSTEVAVYTACMLWLQEVGMLEDCKNQSILVMLGRSQQKQLERERREK